MHTWKRSVLSIAVLAALCVFGAALNQPAVSGDPIKPVNLVSPIPLPVTGTVNVGNLGSSTLPVSVTNFPPLQQVSVANFPPLQQVSGTVNIGTLPPVQAVVTNAPGSVPFSGTLTSSAPQFALPTSVNGQTVEALVVTEVSGFCTGIGSFNLGLQDVNGSPVTTFRFPVGDLLGGIFPLLAQQTHIFIAGGHSVGIDDNTPPHGCHMDLSGYFITQ